MRPLRSSSVTTRWWRTDHTRVISSPVTGTILSMQQAEWFLDDVPAGHHSLPTSTHRSVRRWRQPRARSWSWPGGIRQDRVLTYRIAHLIRDLGVAPDAILAITFTNKAADEMKGRVGSLVGGAIRSMWVSTFHSACVRVLRREASRLGYRSGFSIYDEADSLRLINLVLKDLDVDPKRFPPRAMKAVISKAKNELVDYEAFADQGDGFFHEQVADIYRLYQQRLLEASAMDFDDLLMVTVELFGAFPDVLASYQERFRYVLVDEYQDTNRAQYMLVKQLTASHRNLCVVGDSDQSIYRFRGADIRNIRDFEVDYPDARIVILDQNYRIDRDDPGRSQLGHLQQHQADSQEPVVRSGPGRPHLALRGRRRARRGRVHRRRGGASSGEGFNLSDMAVFYRTNAMSRVIEDVLVRRTVPTPWSVRSSSTTARRSRTPLPTCAPVNPADEVSLKRIINEPRRGIGDTTIAHVDRFSQSQKIGFADGLRRAREIPQLNARAQTAIGEFVAIMDHLREEIEDDGVKAGVESVLSDTGMLATLEAEQPSRRWVAENLRELVGVASEFESSRMKAR